MRVGVFGERFTTDELSRDPARRARALRRGAASMAVFAVLVAAVLAWGYVHDQPLRGGHLTAVQGEVVSFQRVGRGSDRVRVRYTTTAGTSRQAQIPVDVSYRSGQPVDLLYVPTDPSRVRTAEHWNGTWRPAVVLVPVALLLVAGLAAVAARRSEPT